MGRFGWSKSRRRGVRLTKGPRRRSALAFETLEKRWMLTAEIHGFKWSDNDGDAVWDDDEPGLAGVTIYLDADNDGQFDAGEQSTLTAADDPGTSEDETGRYLFTGLLAGTYTVREVLPEGYEQTYPVPPDNDFDLEVIFPDSTLSPQARAIFADAAERWEQIIRGDVPDVFVPGIGIVDDIVIQATGPFIDGPGGILGAAGPDTFRDGSFLPSSGEMFFDSADIDDYIAAGQFDEIILHEMGHVLGIGTIWTELGLLTGFGTTNARFTGAQATAEYNDIFGVTATSVPVESDQGGGGTLYAHWDEATFDNELMTGFINGGVANPLSRITVAQMADLGYEVDLDAADNYNPPGISASLVVAGAPLMQGRILAIDEPGLLLEPLPQLALAALATPDDGFWIVELADGEIVNDVNFGNLPLPSSISGVKWHDRNGDGVRDEGEEGLENWTIYIDENGNGAFDGGGGTVASDDVPLPIEDLSTVESELLVEGIGGAIRDVDVTLTITHSYDDDLSVFLISPAGTRIELFTAVGGDGQDFDGTTLDDEASTSIAQGVAPFRGTFRPLGLLSDVDGEDPNGVWILEVNDEVGFDEGVLLSWSITVLSGERSTTTDAEGFYAFEDLPVGQYVIGEVQQPDWLQSYPLPPGTHTILLGPGQNAVANFGNHKGFIGGLLWNDRDADGVKDDDEAPLPGRTVFLDQNGNGAPDFGPLTFVTNDLPQNIVDFTTITSTIDVADLGDAFDVDVTLNITHTYVSDLDVALISPAGTRIALFNDVGVNGDDFVNTTLDDEAETAVQDGASPFTGHFRPQELLSLLDGEDPNGVWTLEVTDDAGADMGSLLGWSLTITTGEHIAVTDENGEYGFDGLVLATYHVVQVLPLGWMQTIPVGEGGYEVTLAPGQAFSTRDFGSRSASIQGRKFNDLDNDGVQDEGEPGLPGWIIYLDGNFNGLFDDDALTVTSTHSPLPIPDLGTVTSTLTISGLQSVADLNLSIVIDHTYVTDLDAYLISPSGTRVELFTDVGGTSANFADTMLDDEATASIDSGVGPFVGSYRPEGLLSAFDGEDPNGVWTLEVSDDAGNDVGSLKGWSLTIASHDPYVVTDAEGRFAFVDLPPGAYTVGEVQQQDWAQTYPVAPGTHVVSLAPGQQIADVNFGSHSSVLSGDFDDDEDVDGHDFLLWQRGLGSTVAQAGEGADGDGDGEVGAGDLTVWANSFGTFPSPGIPLAEASATHGVAALELAFSELAAVELDASAMMGPLATARAAVPAGPARPVYRPFVRPGEPRAERVAAALVVSAFDADHVADRVTSSRPDDAANDAIDAALGDALLAIGLL